MMSTPSANAFCPCAAAVAIGSKNTFPKIVSSDEDTKAARIASIICAAPFMAFARNRYGFLRLMTFLMLSLSMLPIKFV